jgi:transposase
LAYCWAHVRRDFLKAARSGPALESWMWAWVEDIGDLSRRHAARLEVWDGTVPLAHHPGACVERHGELKSHLIQMQTRCEGQREEKDLHRAKAKVLTSLHNHWDGLTVFVERPEVAMDTNAAERALRPPVVGRKN